MAFDDEDEYPVIEFQISVGGEWAPTHAIEFDGELHAVDWAIHVLEDSGTTVCVRNMFYEAPLADDEEEDDDDRQAARLRNFTVEELDEIAEHFGAFEGI